MSIRTLPKITGKPVRNAQNLRRVEASAHACGGCGPVGRCVPVEAARLWRMRAGWRVGVCGGCGPVKGFEAACGKQGVQAVRKTVNCGKHGFFLDLPGGFLYNEIKGLYPFYCANIVQKSNVWISGGESMDGSSGRSRNRVFIYGCSMRRGCVHAPR